MAICEKRYKIGPVTMER